MSKRTRWTIVVVLLTMLAGFGAGVRFGPTSRSSEGIEFPCPTADSVNYDLSYGLTIADTSLPATHTMVVRASGIKPASPPGSSYAPDSSSRLEDCLIGSINGRVTGYTWSEGQATFEIELDEDRQFFSGGGPARAERDDRALSSDIRLDRSSIWIDPCGSLDHVIPMDVPLVCGSDTRGNIKVVIRDDTHQIFDPVVQTDPAPSAAGGDRTSHEFSWRISGRGQRHEITVRTPWTSVAGAFTSQNGYQFVVARYDDHSAAIQNSDRASLQVLISISGISYLACILLLFIVLWRSCPSPATRGMVAAFTALVFAISGVSLRGQGTWQPAGPALLIFSWMVVAFAARPDRRGRIAAAVLLMAVAGTGGALVAHQAGADVGPSSDLLAMVLALEMIVAVLLGIVSVGSRARDIRNLFTSVRLIPLRRVASMIAAAGAAAVAFAAGFPLGSRAFAGLDQFDGLGEGLLQEANFNSGSLANTVTLLAPVLVTGLAAAALIPWGGRQFGLVPPRSALKLMPLMLAVAAPTAGLTRSLLGISLPLWLLGWLILRAVLPKIASQEPSITTRPESRSHLLNDALADESSRLNLVTLNRSVDGRDHPMDEYAASKLRATTDRRWGSGRRLLEWGETGSWLRNAQRSTIAGTVLAIIPVAYFVFSALSVSDRGSSNSLLLVVFISVITEALRWLVPAFLFGALYAVLPGRIGASKALSLTGIWLTGAAATSLFDVIAEHGSMNELLYRGLQFLIYMLVLATLYDFMTVRRAGGSWRQLRSLYPLRTNADLSATLIPVALAMIGLAQQVASGSGFDVAKTFLEGISSLTGG